MPEKKFNNSNVHNLKCPPDKRQIEYTDILRTGLYILATLAGMLTYMLRFKSPITKKTAHIKIGRVSDLSLDEAREKVTELRKLIAQGIDPRYHKDDEKDGSILYPVFMREQVIPHAKSHIKSWAKTEERFNNYLSDEFNLPLKSISRHHIQEYQTKLLESGLAPATCNRIIQVLRHSLFLAVDWGYLDKNPAERIKMFREDNEVERYLTDEQLIRLVSVLKSDGNRPVSRIIMWLLSTGSRLNETLQAKWENIDKENRTWKIPVADAKSHKSRVVVLSDAAMSVLEECSDTTDWLFPNPQTGKPYTTIRRVWYRIRKEARIEEFRIHDLRHSYASYLAQAGHSTITIAESLGHSDYRVSQRYVHLNQDTKRKAADSASDKIMAAMDKVSGDDPETASDDANEIEDADLKKASGEN